MPSKVRIELNHDGIQELLCSAEVSARCEEAAHAIANAAGDGFEVKTSELATSKRYGTSRAKSVVYTETQEAKLAEAEDKALSQAVSLCRC